MIERYFQAEKTAGQAVLSIGILLAAIGGSMLLKAAAPFYTGMALPFLVIGILQIMVGATLTRRSDLQALDLAQLQQESPDEFHEQETARITRVMQNFTRIKWVEIGLLLIGGWAIWANTVANFPKGLGVGLCIQALIMLIFDFFAEKRSKAYRTFVLQS